ncbi:MAG: LPS export ABC transporter permease LptG [Gammaproteobacteria bacterium]|nr:LPS export ABC transporter permease LptG [Gammaproteobacteria bacterium]
MKLIDRYIANTVVSGTLIALLVVVGLDVFFNVIDQIESLGKGGYTMTTMLQYVALTTPQSLYELFPMAALLGCLMGMGALAANSELTAMRASGVSIWRIVRSVMQVGVLMLVVAVFVGEVIAPVAEQYGQHLRVAATDRGVSFLGSRGLWVRDDTRFINARRVLDQSSLADLTVYEFDDASRLKEATHATHALFREGRWTLHGVRQSAFSDVGVTVSHAETLAWPSLLTPDLLGIVMLKPKNMSATDIDQLVDYLDENGLDTRQYRFAFWGRFMTPISSLVMLFISVPFVFSSLRSVSAGQRIFIGVMVGFGFYILSQVASQMGQVYGLPPLAAMLVPNTIFVLLGIHAIRRL